jgi:hypothetical protein
MYCVSVQIDCCRCLRAKVACLHDGTLSNILDLLGSDSVREELTFVAVRIRNLLAKEWIRLFGPCILTLLVGVVLRLRYRTSLPGYDLIYALADAHVPLLLGDSAQSHHREHSQDSPICMRVCRLDKIARRPERTRNSFVATSSRMAILPSS